MKTWSARKALTVLVVLNILLGVGLFALRSPIATATRIGPPPNPPAKYLEFERLMTSGARDRSFELILDSADITEVARYYLSKRDDIPFDEVTITLGDRLGTIGGVTKDLAVRVPVRAVVKAEARNGSIVASIDDVSLGQTELPDFIKRQIITEGNKALDFGRYNPPILVETLEIRGGQLVLKGKTR